MDEENVKNDEKVQEAETVLDEQTVEKNKNDLEDGMVQNEADIVEKVSEEKSAPQADESSDEGKKIHIHDTDDYLLHLQDILRTIHHAYYELYDDNRKQRDESKAVPDMKIVLPYVRRKVLEKVNIVFSGVVPTNTPLEKSKPYLVAKSLGAVIMDRVTENTTHLIAARLGTAKVFLNSPFQFATNFY